MMRSEVLKWMRSKGPVEFMDDGTYPWHNVNFEQNVVLTGVFSFNGLAMIGISLFRDSFVFNIIPLDMPMSFNMHVYLDTIENPENFEANGCSVELIS